MSLRILIIPRAVGPLQSSASLNPYGASVSMPRSLHIDPLEQRQGQSHSAPGAMGCGQTSGPCQITPTPPPDLNSNEQSQSSRPSYTTNRRLASLVHMLVDKVGVEGGKGGERLKRVERVRAQAVSSKPGDIWASRQTRRPCL